MRKNGEKDKGLGQYFLSEYPTLRCFIGGHLRNIIRKLPGHSPHIRSPPLPSSWGRALHPCHSAQPAGVELKGPRGRF